MVVGEKDKKDNERDHIIASLKLAPTHLVIGGSPGHNPGCLKGWSVMSIGHSLPMAAPSPESKSVRSPRAGRDEYDGMPAQRQSPTKWWCRTGKLQERTKIRS